MHIFVIAAAIILLGWVAVIAWVFGRTYLKFRGDRVITCPENRRPAGVTLAAGHALRMTLEGKTSLRLKSCSRWPEREDCGRECLHQIEGAPEDCLVRNLLTQWYEGKHCALCGKPVGEIQWADHKPALLNAKHETVQWRDIPAETVPEVLASHQPVCWNCHIVNSMIVQHPELVIDRGRPTK